MESCLLFTHAMVWYLLMQLHFVYGLTKILSSILILAMHAYCLYIIMPSLQSTFPTAVGVPVSIATRSGVNKSSGYEVSLTVFGTFLASLDSYLILSVLCRNLSGDSIHRIVSSIFSVLLVAMCVESALVSGPWPLSYIGGTNTVAHTDVLIFTLGFFLYEQCLWVSWWWLGIEKTYKDFILHHLIGIASFTRFLYHGKGGPEAMTVLCFSEATVPLMQLCWFLRQSKSYRRTHLTKIMNSVYACLFWTVRCGVFTVLLVLYTLVSSTKFDLLFKFFVHVFYYYGVFTSVVWAKHLHKTYYAKLKSY